MYFFFSMIRLPPRSPLFPCTPLFRSQTPPAAATAWWAMERSLSPEDVDALFGLADVGIRAGLVGERAPTVSPRSEEHTSELQSRQYLVCRLLLEKKKHTDDRH